MKRSICPLMLALMALTGCWSSASTQSLKSLREITVQRATVLTLGGKMPAVADFCRWSGVMCTLKPGTFGGAKEMSLTVTKSGLISRFDFYYGETNLASVKAQIDDYTRLLGKPDKDATTSSGGVNDRELEWSDSATTFRFSCKTDHKRVEAAATLSDNALAGPAN